MQAQSLCNCVEEGGVWYACRYDLAQIKLDEPNAREDWSDACVANLDKDEEYDGDEEEEGGQEGEDLASSSCSVELPLRRFDIAMWCRFRFGVRGLSSVVHGCRRSSVMLV